MSVLETGSWNPHWD